MAAASASETFLAEVTDVAKDLRRHASSLIVGPKLDLITLTTGVFYAKDCIQPIARALNASDELMEMFKERCSIRKYTVTSKHFPPPESPVEQLAEDLVVSWLTIRGALLSDKVRKRFKTDAASLKPAVSDLASMLREPPFVVPPHDSNLAALIISGNASAKSHASARATSSAAAAPAGRPATAAVSATRHDGEVFEDASDSGDNAAADGRRGSRPAAAASASSAAASRSKKDLHGAASSLADGFPKSLVWVPYEIKARKFRAEALPSADEAIIETVGWPRSGWKAAPAVHAVVTRDGTTTGIAVDPRHSIAPEMALAIDTNIKALVTTEALTPEEAQSMNDAMRDLLDLCHKAVHADKECRIAVYGSAATGLASHGSDVDAVFVGSCKDTAMTGDQVREFFVRKHGADAAKKKGGSRRSNRTYAAPLPMRWIVIHLRSARGTHQFKVIEEIGFARVPILKLRYIPTGLALDLSFNSVLSVHNSQMIRIYMLCDPASRPHQLTTFIKAWAKARSIKDASTDTLSSYTYTLMVIFYMQRRGIVPCLQAPGLIAAYERWRGSTLEPTTVNGHVIKYCGDDVFIRALTEARIASGQYCHENLGSLVVGFFEYYTRVFDWDKYAVSIRLGRPMPRHEWPDAVENRMGIEDPFEEGRDVCVTLGGRHQRYKGQIRIFNEMVRAREMLHSGLCEEPEGVARDAIVADTMERLMSPPVRPKPSAKAKGRKKFHKAKSLR